MPDKKPELQRPWGNKVIIESIMVAIQEMKADELLNISVWGKYGLLIHRSPLPFWWPDVIILDEGSKQRAVELLQGQNLGKIARETGISQVHLTNVRRGTRGFSDRMAKKILDHFGE